MRRSLFSWVLLLPLSVIATPPLAAQTVAGGAGHSAVVKPDGTVWTFGANNNGQLGDNTTATRKTPIPVDGLSSVVAMAAGSDHTVALTSGGLVWAWGDNLYGQLGDASTTDRRMPVPVGINSVVAIAAGEHHSVALRSNGDVYAWGRNTNGQLGVGTTANSSVPMQVAFGAAHVGAGATHTLITKADGTVWASGANGNGQLGIGSTTQQLSPVQMVGVANAVRATGGDRHSVILLSDGTLKAAGVNGSGQIGDGTSSQRSTAVVVSTVTNVAALVAGADHTIALKSDGTVWAWGANSDGQLGDGTTLLRRTPTLVVALSSIERIGAGFFHSTAVDSAGVVSTWGRNGSGQLGSGTIAGRSVPGAISGSAYEWRVATPVFSLGSGTYSTDRTITVTVDTSGATIHYTQNGDEPTEADPFVHSGGTIVVDHTLTLRAKAWKFDKPPSATASASYTMKVATLSLVPGAGTYTSATSVTMTTASPGASIYYTVDGSNPTESSIPYAGPVAIATTTTLMAIGVKSNWSSSDVRSAAYTMNYGTLAAPSMSPGSGIYQGSVEIGLSGHSGTTIRYTTNGSTPTATSPIYTAPIALMTTATVKARAFHPDYTTSAETAATYTIQAQAPVLSVGGGLHAPGTVVTITSPDSAATLRVTLTGTDPTTTDAVIAPGSTLLVGTFTLKVRAFKAGNVDSAVAAASYVLTEPLSSGAVAASGAHTVLGTPQGLLYAWGENGSGEIGDGSATDRTVPTLIPTLTGVTALAAGDSHTLAATWDGRLFTWGSNGSGRLGDGSTTNRSRPVPVTALSNVVSVAAGESHSLALTDDGLVYAWGNGGLGRLGLGSLASQSVPTLVPGLSDVVAIAAGGSHSLAATSTGQLYAWGANGSGQLGDGSTNIRLNPTLIDGISGVSDLAAGTFHSLALMYDGRVMSWGSSASGQLGLGTTIAQKRPAFVLDLIAADIAAGGTHSAAVRTDGVLVTWGGNSSGQLGDTTTTMRLSPTIVVGPDRIGALTAGAAHTVVVTPDAHVWTWGSGGSGRLGDGTTTTRLIPQEVFVTTGAWGTTPPPVLTLAPGAYATPQAVVVSHPWLQVVMRYTTSGAVPTESDPEIFSGAAVDVKQSLTLRVRAWGPGFSPSQIVTATYIIDTTPPAITAQTSSAPNAAGWYAGDVTVTFTCSDPESTVTFCSPPITVTDDGEAINVTGQATSAAGLGASVVVTLSIDSAVPFISTYAPSAAGTLPTGTASVTIRGNAVDAPSGVERVICAGVAAEFSNQNFSCSVAVSDGSNAIKIEAFDRAGNTIVRVITVIVGDGATPTAIDISPKTMTMIPGTTREVVVKDDRGRVVVSDSWSVSQPLVAALAVANGVNTVRALASGESILTVTYRGLLASATVTVVAADTTTQTGLPDGTTLWTLSGTTASSGEVLRPAPVRGVDGAEGPALVFVDDGTIWVGDKRARASGQSTRIRATFADGRELWEHTFDDRVARQIAADANGGVVIVFDSQWVGGKPVPASIRRLDGLTGAVSWEYFSPFLVTITDIAVHPDGTILATERNFARNQTDVIAIAPTGSGQRLLSLPRGRYRHYLKGVMTKDVSTLPTVSHPLVRDDGTIVVLSVREFEEDYEIDLGSHSGPDPDRPSSVRRELKLVEFTTTSLTQVLDVEFDSGLDRLDDKQLFPDGDAGYLLGSRTTPWIARIAKVGSEWSVIGKLLDTNSTNLLIQSVEYVLGEDGVYALAHGVTGLSPTPFWAKVYSVDPVALTVATESYLGFPRAVRPNLQLKFALAGGGVYISGPAEAHAVNASVSAAGFAAGGNATQIVKGIWAGWNGGPAASVGSGVDLAHTVWNQPRGSVSGRGDNVATNPDFGIFVKAHNLKGTGFNHLSMRVVPQNPERWIERIPNLFKDTEGKDIRDEREHLYFTIGAGPSVTKQGLKPTVAQRIAEKVFEDKGFCWGFLRSDPNRDSDITKPPEEFEKLHYSRALEDELIQRLLTSDKNYDDDLRYACIPVLTDDKYNSNSYISGLLRVVDLPAPSFPSWYEYPGWGRPVPVSKFLP